MSAGITSDQTWQPTKSLAFLANASATVLPLRGTWTKLTNRNEDNAALSWVTALITVAESPSKITLRRPRSAANWTAQRHAKASISVIELANGIDIDRAPMAWPHQWRTMTPSPAVLDALKTAASKFTLWISGSEGHHWCSTAGLGISGSSSWTARNSCNNEPACRTSSFLFFF